MNYSLSQSGYRLISRLEGVRENMYDDGYGNDTIGIGHVVRHPDYILESVTGLPTDDIATLNEEEIKLLFLHDINPTIDYLSTLNSDLTISQIDALVSFIFNIGLPEFKTSSSTNKSIQANNYRKAADDMLLYIDIGTQIRVPGLIKRRNIERLIFMNPTDDLDDISTFDTTTHNEIVEIVSQYKTDLVIEVSNRKANNIGNDSDVEKI